MTLINEIWEICKHLSTINGLLCYCLCHISTISLSMNCDYSKFLWSTFVVFLQFLLHTALPLRDTFFFFCLNNTLKWCALTNVKQTLVTWILLVNICGELNTEMIHLIIAKKSPLGLLPSYLQSVAVYLPLHLWSLALKWESHHSTMTWYFMA